MSAFKLAVLSSGLGWHVRDLFRAGAEIGVEVDSVDFRDLRCLLSNDEMRVFGQASRLDDADAVLVRTMPGGSLEQVIWRMDVLHALTARGVRVVNSPRALETSIDKFLCLVRLREAGLPVPPTISCESPASAEAAFDSLGRDVVMKPLFGSEGCGILRVRDRDALEEAVAVRMAEDGIFYLQRFLESGGEDLRILVSGDEVLASMHRSAPPGEWITNIAQGGTATKAETGDGERDLAMRAARAVDAEIAGVDLLRDDAGNLSILEVNAVPGWRALSGVCERDLGRELLEGIVRRTGR